MQVGQVRTVKHKEWLQKKSEVEALQGVLSLKSPAGCVIKSLFPFLSMHQAIDITLIEL